MASSQVLDRSVLEAAVLAALDTVTDPELDDSLVRLGFASASVDEVGTASIELRLPTYWCAANFAFLMANDAREAVRRVPGVTGVRVTLHDHFAGSEVSGAVNTGRTFDEAFAELADGMGLDALRRLFKVKAFTRRQEAVIRALQRQGRAAEEIAGLRLGAMSFGSPSDREHLERYLERRRDLGLPLDPASPAVLMPDGSPLAAPLLDHYLRRARLTAVSIDSNSAFCTGLHATRYPVPMEVAR